MCVYTASGRAFAACCVLACVIATPLSTVWQCMCVCVCCQAATKDFCGHSAAVEGVVFTPDDSLLLSVGGEDTTLCQWRVVWRDVAAVARPGAGTEAATRAALAKAHQQWVRGARWLGHPACMLWR